MTKFTLDDLDYAILTHLQKDGRKPFTEIAKDLGVTDGTIRTRVARMVDSGTLSIIGTLNPLKVGYDAPALIHIAIEPKRLMAAKETIAAFPEVSYAILVAGDCDLIIEVVCRDRAHLTELVLERIHQVAGVTQTRIYLILQMYKLVEPDLQKLLGKPEAGR